MLKVSLEYLEDLNVTLDHDTRNWSYESDQHQGYHYNAIPLLDNNDCIVGHRVYRKNGDTVDEYLSIPDRFELNLNMLDIPFVHYN